MSVKLLNKLAREVAKLEGKKESLSIAQIKEVILCICKVQANSWFQSDEGEYENYVKALDERIEQIYYGSYLKKGSKKAKLKKA